MGSLADLFRIREVTASNLDRKIDFFVSRGFSECIQANAVTVS